MSPDLRALLAATSRSFYLSLVALPRATRGAIALAYLLARAADTIADSTLVPLGERLAHLGGLADGFRGGGTPAPALVAAIARAAPAPGSAPAAGPAAALAARAGGPGVTAAEAALLARLPQAVDLYAALPAADRTRTGGVLATIVDGMVLDLRWFPDAERQSGDPPALASERDLDRYCFHVAGSVGVYWTEMHLAHGWRASPAVAERAIRLAARYGEALQLINILRDLPRDFARGRCYLPADALAARGLDGSALLDRARWPEARPVIDRLLARARAGLDAGRAYGRLLPAGALRLRLATALPLLIGLRTLALLERAPSLLDPALAVKVPRREVYGLLASALVRTPSARALDAFARRVGEEAGR